MGVRWQGLNDRKTVLLLNSVTALVILAYLTATLMSLLGKCTLTPIYHIFHSTAIFLCLCICARTAAGNDSQKRELFTGRAFVIGCLLYTFTVLFLTLLDSYYGRGVYSLILRWKQMTPERLSASVNLVPLKTVFLYIKAFADKTLSIGNIIINLAGNAVVFMPFALYLPVIFKKQRKFWIFTLTMTAAVGLVELLQLALLTGSCDIDDLILNVAGACGAYGVLHIKRIRALIQRLTLTEY